MVKYTCIFNMYIHIIILNGIFPSYEILYLFVFFGSDFQNILKRVQF